MSSHYKSFPQNIKVQFKTFEKLNKIVNSSDLTVEFGGTKTYSHAVWLQNKLDTERYLKEISAVKRHIDAACGTLLTVPESLTWKCLHNASQKAERIYKESQEAADKTKTKGANLIIQLQTDPDTGFHAVGSFNNVDVKKVEGSIAFLQENLRNFEEVWKKNRNVLFQAAEFLQLKEGMQSIIDDATLYQKKVLEGTIRVESESDDDESQLQQHNEILLHCAEIYARFAKVRRHVTNLIVEHHHFANELTKNRSKMDAICYALASQLYKKKEIISTSKKFHLLLQKYFEHLEDTKVFLAEVPNFDDQLKINNIQRKISTYKSKISNLSKHIFSEGLNLSHLLNEWISPREIIQEQQEFICKWLNISDKEQNLLLQKLDLLDLKSNYLQQILKCENDAVQSAQWLDDLCKLMKQVSLEIGESEKDIEVNIADHKNLQAIGRDTYDYGRKLLGTALELRLKNSHNLFNNSKLASKLFSSWQAFLRLSHLRMTQLELCMCLHRRIASILQRTETLRKSLENNLILFGTVRKSFVVSRQQNAWQKVISEFQECFRLGTFLLNQFKQTIKESSEGKGNEYETVADCICQILTKAWIPISELEKEYFGTKRLQTIGSDSGIGMSDDFDKLNFKDWYNALSLPGTDFKNLSKYNDDYLLDQYLSHENMYTAPKTPKMYLHNTSLLNDNKMFKNRKSTNFNKSDKTCYLDEIELEFSADNLVEENIQEIPTLPMEAYI